jgi:hypothetical protein
VIDGEIYTVIHNVDWSGDATIVHQKRDAHDDVVTEVPGKLIRAIGRKIALEEVLRVVEDAVAELRRA